MKEAHLQKKNDQIPQLTIFIHESGVICKNTPFIGLNRAQTDNEVLKKVQIRLLPLNWIYMDNGSISDLFNFFRANLDKLRGTLLLDLIFEAFWEEQQLLILKYCFYPYVFYFIVAQIYYLYFTEQDVTNWDDDKLQN